MIRKKTVALGAAVATALLVAGCGSSGGSGSSNGTTTLNVGLFGTFGFQEAGLYKEYMAAHPNIKIVEHSVEQSADYYKALQTHLAAGSGLDDIQGIEIGFVADIVANHANQFVDFAHVPNSAQIQSTFYDWKWAQASTKDGKVVGLGTDAGPEAMCFRKDLFQQAGLPTDRAQLGQMWSTWDGFINVGKQYEASATKPASSHFLDSAASIFSAAVYQGKFAYADENGKPIPATSDGVQSAWKYDTDAATAKLTAGLTQFGDQWNSAFANGAFAAISCPAWMLGYIKSQAGDQVAGKWDVAPLPGGSANWGGSWLGVPTASKHQKEAEDLVVWLTAPEQQVKMFTKEQHWPSSSTAAEDQQVTTATNAYFSDAPIGQIFGEVAKGIQRTPISPYDTQIQNAFTTALTNVETKGQDPDQAFNDALKNAQDAIGG